jgi:hypothetical protein
MVTPPWALAAAVQARVGVLGPQALGAMLERLLSDDDHRSDD